MDDARTFFNDFIAAADQRLTQGVEDQRSTATALRWVSVIGGLIIIAVVGGSAWTVMTYTRELAQTRAELEAANLGLEERVQGTHLRPGQGQ